MRTTKETLKDMVKPGLNGAITAVCVVLVLVGIGHFITGEEYYIRAEGWPYIIIGVVVWVVLFLGLKFKR